MSVSPDARRWDREAADLRHTGLKDLRDRATAWQGSIAAFLGVFSLAAFVKGPDTLKSLPGSADFPLVGKIDVPLTSFWIYLVGVILIAIAYGAAVLAAQGTPSWSRVLSGRQLETATVDSGITCIRWFRISRACALAALLLVFAATALVWAAQVRMPATSSAQSVLVLTANGSRCGALTTGADGSIQVGGSTIDAGSQITIVSSCP